MLIDGTAAISAFASAQDRGTAHLAGCASLVIRAGGRTGGPFLASLTTGTLTGEDYPRSGARCQRP